MDISSLLGMLGGMAVIVGAILLGGSLNSFVDVPSIVVVFGGTLTSTMVAEKLPNVIAGIKIGMKAFFFSADSPEATIKVVDELSQAARKDGILALENFEVKNPFLAKAVRFAVDGIAPEDVRANLSAELVAMKSRHKRGKKLFDFMTASAPSMGMIGTLIGLVLMLKKLDDPAQIGPSMAVALLTTFYGALIAFVICGPIAAKLEVNSDMETENMKIIMEGIDGILKGDNPRVLNERLEGYLPPSKRTPDDKK